MGRAIFLCSMVVASCLSAGCNNGITEDEWRMRYTATLTTPIDMPFWLKPEWYGRVSDEDYGDHPCGGYGMVRSTRIPAFPEARPLAPSPAFEVIDGKATDIGWDLPINNQIWAVAGDWLLITETSSSGPAYWVNRDGRILASRNIPASWMQSSGRWCPTALGPEGSMFCASLRDKLDGRARTIAGETVCT